MRHEMRLLMEAWFDGAEPEEIDLACEMATEISNDPNVPEGALQAGLIARLKKIEEEHEAHEAQAPRGLRGRWHPASELLLRHRVNSYFGQDESETPDNGEPRVQRTPPRYMRPRMEALFNPMPVELDVICEVAAELHDESDGEFLLDTLVTRLNQLADEGSRRSTGYWRIIDGIHISRDPDRANGRSTEPDTQTKSPFELAFRDAYDFATIAGGDPRREITLQFTGETAGAAIAGLSEWATANESQDNPFIVEAIRLKIDPLSSPTFVAIVTVMDIR